MAPAPGDSVPAVGAENCLEAGADRRFARASRVVAVAGALLPALAAQGLAFALLVGSGKMPPLVLRVFRALLTL